SLPIHLSWEIFPSPKPQRDPSAPFPTCGDSSCPVLGELCLCHTAPWLGCSSASVRGEQSHFTCKKIPSERGRGMHNSCKLGSEGAQSTQGVWRMCQVMEVPFGKGKGGNPSWGSFQEPYPKGVIPLSVIEMARSTKDNKFQVITSHRIFVFRAENEAQRNEWCSTLQKKVMEQRLVGSRPRPANTAHCQKSGTLELKGHKSKVFAALSLPEMWLYKSEQFFKMGIAMFFIEMRGSTIREAKSRSFELITPSKTFSFVAESEREKREWMEALQEAIAEMLYDYEVAEKIWSNKANKYCADCWAQSPDWASINLCVVICKQCAGQHRSLGSNISKVQSLKLDTSVWSNEIVQLFIVLGNDRANRFWAARLPSSEAITPESGAEQRREFIARKYREGRYRLPHPHYGTQEEVLQVGDTSRGWSHPRAPGLRCQPLLPGCVCSEPCSSSRLRNALSPLATLTAGISSPWGSTEPTRHSPALGPLKGTPSRAPSPAQRAWGTQTAGLGSLLWLWGQGQGCPHGCFILCRFRFTLELFLTGEKVQQLGTDGPETLQAWASAIGKWFTPVSCHCLLGYEFQRVGQLRYKCMLNPERWQRAFFILQKSHLFICPAEEDGAEDSINLRRLQELSLVPPTDTPEKKELLVLVEMGRTFYLQGLSRADSAAWYSDIQASAGGRGNALRDQQLSRADIPIIVDSCIAFITQYGEPRTPSTLQHFRIAKTSKQEAPLQSHQPHEGFSEQDPAPVTPCPCPRAAARGDLPQERRQVPHQGTDGGVPAGRPQRQAAHQRQLHRGCH
uniref:ArfGAP with RhoGAP domain, ankyrin repeat and PH domain 3 n=1 Tax=Zonotrichia albicollis TaxID=44394 RepID=A0A8D2MAY9_ZONAL